MQFILCLILHVSGGCLLFPVSSMSQALINHFAMSMSAGEGDAVIVTGGSEKAEGPDGPLLGRTSW